MDTSHYVPCVASGEAPSAVGDNGSRMEDTPTSVDEYLQGQSDETRAVLAQVRLMVREAAPDAVESIGYGIPAYKYRGKVLIYFGAAKKHWSLYGGGGNPKFKLGEAPSAEHVKALVAARMADIDAAAAKRKARP